MQRFPQPAYAKWGYFFRQGLSGMWRHLSADLKGNCGPSTKIPVCALYAVRFKHLGFLKVGIEIPFLILSVPTFLGECSIMVMHQIVDLVDASSTLVVHLLKAHFLSAPFLFEKIHIYLYRRKNEEI